MADDRVYGFDAAGASRVVRGTRAFEANPNRPRRALDGEVPNWQHVRITGAEVGTGSGSGGTSDVIYYPGEVVIWDAADEEGAVSIEVWVHPWNDEILHSGTIYPCRQSGTLSLGDDERAVFVTACTPGDAREDDDGSGSGSGAGDGDGGCSRGIGVNWCQPDGTSVPACMSIENNRLVVRDLQGNLLDGG